MAFLVKTGDDNLSDNQLFEACFFRLMFLSAGSAKTASHQKINKLNHSIAIRKNTQNYPLFYE